MDSSAIIDIPDSELSQPVQIPDHEVSTEQPIAIQDHELPSNDNGVGALRDMAARTYGNFLRVEGRTNEAIFRAIGLTSWAEDAKTRADQRDQQLAGNDNSNDYFRTNPALENTFTAGAGNAAGNVAAMAPTLAIGGLTGIAATGIQSSAASFSEARDAYLKQNPGDEAGADSEGLKAAGKTILALPAYLIVGKLASSAAGKLVPEGANALTKFAIQGGAATAANVGTSATIRGVEGQPIIPETNAGKAESLVQDVLFGAMHGYGEATKPEEAPATMPTAEEVRANPSLQQAPEISPETPNFDYSKVSIPDKQELSNATDENIRINEDTTQSGQTIAPEEGSGTSLSPNDGESPLVTSEGRVNSDLSQEAQVLNSEGPGSELNAPIRQFSESDRIDVAPIPGGETTKLNDIIVNFGQAVGKNVYQGERIPGSAGVYSAKSGKVSIRFSGDLDTTAHEVAHAIDDRYGLTKLPLTFQQANELKQFAVHGSQNGNEAAEGMAEYIRARIVNPEKASQAAPELTKLFNSKVAPKDQTAIGDFSRKVREFAGLPATEQIKTNIRFKLPDLSDRLLNTFRANGNEFSTPWWTKLRSKFQDELAPVVRAIAAGKKIKELGPQLPEKDPETLLRVLAGFNGKAESMLESGLVDARNKPVLDPNTNQPLSTQWLLEPFKGKNQAEVQKQLEDAVSYMVARRTVEKSGQGKTLITGAGAGLTSDLVQSKKALAEFSLDPHRLAMVEEAARRYGLYADQGLKYAVEKGRISKEQYNQIRSENEYYVNLQRVMNDIDSGYGSGKAVGSAKNNIHTFKGSSRVVENPYVSVLEKVSQLYHEADRNEVVRSVTDILQEDRSLHQGKVKDLAAIGYKVSNEEPNAIKVFRKGQEERWKFEDAVQQALTAVGTAHNDLWKVITLPATLTRQLITHSPGFLVRNVIRDAQERFVLSRTRSNPLNSAAPTFETLFGLNKEEVKQFRLAGGDQAGHYMSNKVAYHKALAEEMRSLSNDKGTVFALPWHFGKALANSYGEAARRSELVGRLSEYRQAYQHATTKLGYNDFNASIYAAGQARNLMDFAVAGSIGRQINQVVPFTNAGIQGLNRIITGFSDNKVAFVSRWGMYMVAPSVMNWAWNYSQGTLDKYRQLPWFQRDFFTNWYIGPDLILRIPKSFELGVMSSGADRMLDYSAGNAKAFEGYAGSVAKSLMPLTVDDLAGPYKAVIEGMANYDFFRNKQIVPAYEQDLRLDLRKGTAYASRLGQALQHVLGVDARQIDHFILSLGGGVGGLAINASNIGRADRPFDAQAILGVTTHLNPSFGPDMQFVEQHEKQEGRARGDMAQVLNDLSKKYYSAKDPADREKIAAIIRARSAKFRENIEAHQ